MAAAALALGLVVLVAWSVLGRIPTRVSGDGILLSSGGRLVDAVSAVSGKLASLDVGIGDAVRRDQVIARVVQTETEQRLRQARDVLREREREHAELTSAISREIDAKLANYAAQEAGLGSVIAAAEKRTAYLTDEVAKLEPAAANGTVTRRYLEDRRVELNNARERITDARNDRASVSAIACCRNSRSMIPGGWLSSLRPSWSADRKFSAPLTGVSSNSRCPVARCLPLVRR
jgi:HlyD family secretion protein